MNKEQILEKIELNIKLTMLIRYVKKEKDLPKRILQDLEYIHGLWKSVRGRHEGEQGKAGMGCR